MAGSDSPQLAVLGDRVDRMEQTAERLVEALDRLTRLEERREADSKALERAFGEIDKLQKAVENNTAQMAKWINRGIGIWLAASAIWAGFGAYIAFR